MARVIADPCHPLDHLTDPLQRPELILVAVGARSLQQRALHRLERFLTQTRPAPRPAGTGKTLATTLHPAPMPDAGSLDADPELLGHLRRTMAIGEQNSGALPPLFQAGEVSPWPNSRCSVGCSLLRRGLRHPNIVPLLNLFREDR